MVRPPLTPNGAAGLELCLSIFDGYDLAMADSGRYPRVIDFIFGAEHVSEKDEVMRNVELILDGLAARLP
jgi:hypothetical protein